MAKRYSFLLILVIYSGVDSLGKERTSGSGFSGVKQIEKPLKVTGQTRTLTMMLVLRNEKEKVRFLKPRENFRKEIVNTQWHY